MNSDESSLDNLCQAIRLAGPIANDPQYGVVWPTAQLRELEQAEVSNWFVPKHLGGAEWTPEQIVAAYIRLSSVCLTTTFILTQRAAAIRRICLSDNEPLRTQLLDEILGQHSHATVGISHLTTSRRHIGKPALAAIVSNDGYRLNGFSPWVTGAIGCDWIITGAELEDRNQVLVAVPKSASGVTVEPGFEMVALTASQTGQVRFDDVEIGQQQVLAGPSPQVLSSGSVSTTGGFQTSALATGLATAAIEFLAKECERRPEMQNSCDSLKRQLAQSTENLLSSARGNPVCSNEDLRAEANQLALRATQAAMVAAKGAGFVAGHPVGRWCREALFFLVWSCPQAVANANMCEFAGIES